MTSADEIVGRCTLYTAVLVAWSALTEARRECGWSGAVILRDFGEIERLAVRVDVLEGEEEAGWREAINGEARGQARALEQPRGPDLRGLGANRLAS